MRKPPFSIERHAQRNLSTQMAEGLRNAILTGFYKEGEILPKILDWAKMFGVSIRVPEAAVATLVREGLVVTHPGVGCVVRPRATSIWRGHVLLVMPDSTTVYHANIMSERIRKALSESGWLVSQIDVPHDSDGEYDLSRLEFALKHPVELAIVLASRSPIESLLSSSGTNFAVYGEKPCVLPHCVGHIRLDLEAAIPDFVRHCTEADVRDVLQVWKLGAPKASRALRKAGIKVTTWLLPEPDGLRPEAVERTAIDAFKARLAKGRDWLPDLFFFSDDYLAAGAITALLHENVRIPEDVRLVSIYNKGLGPVTWDTLACWELDSHTGGDLAARHILAWLDGDRRSPISCTIGTTYHRGSTFS